MKKYSYEFDNLGFGLWEWSRETRESTTPWSIIGAIMISHSQVNFPEIGFRNLTSCIKEFD